MQPELFHLYARCEDTHWWFVVRRAILRAIVHELVPPGQGRVVVDVGCATGANIASLADGYVPIGIDQSEHAIALASSRFPHVRFIRGEAPRDLGDLAARASAFFIMDVMEHVRDDFAMLSRLIAVASPGAYFVITVPADMSLWSAHDEVFAHFRRYTAARLAAVWDGLPVETRLLTHFNSRLYPLVWAARTLGRFRKRGLGEHRTDLAPPPPLVGGVLRRIFGGERDALLSALRHGGGGFARGVSLIAILRRTPGVAEVRARPASIPPDPHDPELHP